MKSLLFFLAVLMADQALSQSYLRIHKKAVVADTHNDILTQVIEKNLAFDTDLRGKTHSDIGRMKQGGLDAQLFSVWCDGDRKEPYQFANRQIDTLDAVIARNASLIEKVSDRKSMLKTIRRGKIAAMIGVEGGHMIENDINKLDSLHDRGVRYMTLTWNNSSTWATSAFDEKFKKDLAHKGLNDFGIQVVKRMNTLGMMVDISHVGEETFYDVIKTTSKPIIASHSSVYAICPHQRNLNDEQIRAIAKNGGVIQINFYSGFLDSTFERRKKTFLQTHQSEIDSIIGSGQKPSFAEDLMINRYPEEADALRAPLSLVIQHISYIAKLVGVKYVGIGSDFDGIEAPPQLLNDVASYPLITKALLQAGYSKLDVRKILGGNFLRVLKANE